MDTKQDFKGLDGAIAWHLIERQAENWNQVGEMMNEWLKANTPTKEWVSLMRGIRVEGNSVIITVNGYNDEARFLCKELIDEMTIYKEKK